MHHPINNQFAVLSINHQRAPIAVREQIHRAESALHDAIQHAIQSPAHPTGIIACIVLSTCNRTELYVQSSNLQITYAWLLSCIATFVDCSDTELINYCYYRQNHEAELYVYRVACGLESLIFGEAQIIGQMRRALIQANRHHTSSRFLQQLVISALRAGKQAQHQTAIGRHSISVAHIAVAAIQQMFGTISPQIMIWGAGEIAQLTAQALHQHHIPFRISNRSPIPATQLAQQFNANTTAWEQRFDEIGQSNVLIVTTHAPQYVLTIDQYCTIHAPYPSLIIDLSVPRNVDPQIAQVTALIDIDALQQIVDHHKAQRQEAQPAVEAIITQHYYTFINWKHLQRTTAEILQLRNHAQQICHTETQLAHHLLTHTNRTPHAIITQLGHRITNKLLHAPTIQIRKNALTTAKEEYHHLMNTAIPTQIRIGTRGSALALWQSDYVGNALKQIYPTIHITNNVIVTKGDIDIQSPLPLIGGKGLFTAEIEQQLMNHDIDIAVHSLKDLPTDETYGLPIIAIPMRGDHADVLVSRHDYTLSTLPHGATVGTSSIRRAAQLRRLRPDLRITDIRGNINSRLQKAYDPINQFDAIVLAQAGLTRLNLHKYISYVFRDDEMLCAPGQGALAVQSHQDQHIMACMQSIHDTQTAIAVTLERGILAHLGGGCSAPIAAHAARLHNHTYQITARVLSRDGHTCIEEQATHTIHTVTDAFAISADFAEALRQKGADTLLNGTTL